MKIEVHMKNGRTTFRFAKRSALRKVLAARDGVTPDHEGPRVMGEIRHNPEGPWIPASVRHISAGAISHVIEVPPEQGEPEKQAVVTVAGEKLAEVAEQAGREAAARA